MRSMMLVSLCLLVIAGIGGESGQAASAQSDVAKLQGTWEVVAGEVDGKRVDLLLGAQYEFAKDKFRTIDTSERPGRWETYSLDETVAPKRLTWQKTFIFKTPGKADEVVTRVMLYRLDGDKLELWIPSKRRTKQGIADVLSIPHYVVLILKRVPFANPDEERARQQARQQAAKVRVRQGAYYKIDAFSVGGSFGTYHFDFRGLPRTYIVRPHAWQALLVLRDGVRRLTFRGCRGVGDEETKHLAQMTRLAILDLCSTDVSDVGVSRLGGVGSLEDLDLSFTSVTDAGLATIAKMAKLKKITLNGSLVTPKGVEKLRAERPDLEVVWLRPYAKSEQEAVRALSQLGFVIDDVADDMEPKVVTCQILFTGRKIVPASVVEAEAKQPRPLQSHAKSIDRAVVIDLLGKLPAPTAVTVGETTDDSVFPCLAKIQGLTRLDLSQSKITDAGLATLKDHQTLRVLSLQGTKKVTDVGVASLVSLPNLEVLNLQGIRSTPEALTKLLDLGQLRELRIRRWQTTRELNDKFRRNGVDVTAP